jgi:predicted nucleic acid-binding protein
VITLDASVLIAHFRPVDEHHVLAGRLLAEHAGGGFAVHPLNLAEVLVGGVRIVRAEEMLADLREMGVEVMAPKVDDPLELATLRAKSGLKLPDCCALQTAMTRGTPIGTFDDALASAARQEGVEVLPG